VEHSPNWQSQISAKLADRKLSHAAVELITADENDIEYDWRAKWPFFSTLKCVPPFPEYKEYMHSIDKYPDQYFDCIVIDGQARIACLLHAIPKLAHDGIIIFDDSASDRYQQAFLLMNGWHYKNYRFGLGQTTFFARDKNILRNL
jgi:hypothetical protein